ncbi:phage tail protein [Moraxella sp. VT-16-12]|uniref:phage tail assembly protein T n=1 Tax=Moraxella sp. VT-16-12 TaxID=2014877 RepID=UPI000B7CB1E9|nr:phage tail protein [Moraxella sp. VT-16-12]TWV81511.1 phage tail protein [Moraxella sp. VT-16-12]
MFKLAGHLGKTVSELERTLTISELAEWRAYDEIDPIGGYRMDLGFALLAYLQAGDTDKSLADFLVIDPNPMTDDERQVWEDEQHAIKARAEVQAMIAMFGKMEQSS